MGRVFTLEVDIERLADVLAEKLAGRVPQAPVWLTVAQAAEPICCSERWLRARLIEIPHIKVDGKVLLNRGELDGWLLAHRRPK
jgi:hypothetical protein